MRTAALSLSVILLVLIFTVFGAFGQNQPLPSTDAPLKPNDQLLTVDSQPFDANPDPLETESPDATTEAESAVAPGGAELAGFSPSVAKRFYELARELSDTRGPGETRQALVFAKAALELDNNATYARALLIDLAARDETQDYSQLLRRLLNDYVGPTADVAIAGRAVGYMLDRLDSREERERLLEELVTSLGNKNPIFGSDIATVLAILMAEKSNAEAAGFYFAQAYKNNKNNKLAFARLAELFPDKLGPELYLEHLRLALREDPASIEAALDLAQYAEHLELYDIAAPAYEYCATLLSYLTPSQPLPPQIYLPWAVCCYNAQRPAWRGTRCLQIASIVRQSGRFDLRLEALAGKAAAKMGDGEQATAIFRAAEEKAQQLLQQGPTGPRTASSEPRITAVEIAWFYCLALPNPQKALDWANKAYATEPNSPAAAILAYALVMNGQGKWAKPLIENHPASQISELARAKILLADGDQSGAIDALKSVIAKDPGSVAAEHAKELLTSQASHYLPPVDADIVMEKLQQTFGPDFIPAFTAPDKIITVQLNLRGNKFPYGSDISGVVAVRNNWTEPLVISNDGFFKGTIRIDAKLTGPITKSIPNLVLMTVRTDYLIQPGKSILIPVNLVTGELRKTLMTHPQASVDIEFTLYLDPVLNAQGRPANRLSNLQPITARVERPGIELSGTYLRNRFNLISKGQVGQKVKTAQLFVGLLAEQYAMSGRKSPYKFMYADWMPTMFRNALVHESGLLRNPTDGLWLVKVHTMTYMTILPLDHELITAVAENLNSSRWPVRMMAIYLLAKSQARQFEKVLDWAAQYDPHPLVREMAAALAATKLKASDLPAAKTRPVGPKEQ